MRKQQGVESIRKRTQKWKDEDPSSLITKQIEKATQPLQYLVSLLVPEIMVLEVCEKTLWAAEVLTDRSDILKTFQTDSLDKIKQSKLEYCDQAADQVHNWSLGAGAALGAWDLAGPLGVAPALASIFTLSFRTIKKIGLCYGYDTSKVDEERIVLEIFFAGTSFYHRDKCSALKEIERPVLSVTKEDILETMKKLSKPMSANLIRRRSLASIPAMGALVGGSANAWLLSDIGWAARNIYAMRRLEEAKALKAATPKPLAKAA